MNEIEDEAYERGYDAGLRNGRMNACMIHDQVIDKLLETLEVIGALNLIGVQGLVAKTLAEVRVMRGEG